MIGAIATGMHAEALDLALRYARDRKLFGGRVIDQQGLQWSLADAETDLVAGRLLTRRAAEALGSAEGTVAVAHAKRFCPDAALRAVVLASQILGAYGWLENHPLVRFMDLAKMLQTVDGTTEVQRVIIARDLLKRAEELGPEPS
jgi:alkylation response protein AidB-like acyl-CoA dehydrogenase